MTQLELRDQHLYPDAQDGLVEKITNWVSVFIRSNCLTPKKTVW